MGKVVTVGGSRKLRGEVLQQAQLYHKSEDEAILRRAFTSVSGVSIVL